ncbi:MULTISPECIES: helix-turn-helix domain-containing protein [unclassified Clostridioides]|uniref:helix-turn-helix domain-containing protein n=1 Tax=unclassified Clostridioides TaxID=2635829 RepID=UPI001D12A91C|nr:helix-turn-helix domain-containing protein [Clostridioides sp. ES-S-0049-03]MCC0672001.1 helix-turn-helix domain-containing protein [Clostridioides sp. ES-S-0145-01]MCC0675991.1 helix-turn-helix domain-containing protein [Clostridioides sp. ES-W-0018-02]MCC0681319.1 helix-turn-helix domain-containing protein [Clostridioides sp. ES-S-0005-03]MCC0703992.1 helix-turn-helix domain-containing protein [Clostridioides sp. ES-S-0049-02]MCC0710930.1 helix-turn-helix domain-containing protein [Clostr
MNDKLMDCFINPVKCKLLLEIYSNKQTTAKQLAEKFKDISQATLYRYLDKMLKDNILKVVEENKIRGTVEKVYAVKSDIDDDAKKMINENSAEAYVQLFTQYMMAFMKEFYDYAKREEKDILKDGSVFSVCPIYANLEEITEVARKIGDILEPLRNNSSGEGRKMHSIGLIIAPPKEE